LLRSRSLIQRNRAAEIHEAMTDRTQSAGVAVLMPKVWSIRNVVTSGLAEELAASGVRVTLLPRETKGFESILPPNVPIAVEPLLRAAQRKQVRGTTRLARIHAVAFRHRHGTHGQWPAQIEETQRSDACPNGSLQRRIELREERSTRNGLLKRSDL
jgi:hypothetical protein